MKTIKLIIFGMMLLFAASTQAQLSIRVNIGTPPAWGPAGYNDVHYYYLPDIECYYDVQNSMFIYFWGNRWVHRRHLPPRYRNYDLYGGYKVVMNDYHGHRPYEHFREYRARYAPGYRGQEQRNIGERHENHGRGHQGMEPNRMNNREENRMRVQPNNRVQSQGNNRDHGPWNNKGQGHGNDKKEGHDNGNRK